MRDTLRPAAAAASGFLLVLAFPSIDLGWLAWIALVPLLVAIDGQDPPRAFRLGYLAGVVFFGGLLGWVRLFGLPAWIVLTLLLAIFSGIAAAGVRVLARGRRAALLWVVPVLWVAVEVVRSVGPVGFPWGLLGLTQYRSERMMVLASIIGAFGLSGLIALVNAVGAVLLTTRRVTAPLAVAAVAALLMALAAPLAVRTTMGTGDVRLQRIVAAIQPNVPPARKNEGDAVGGIALGLLRQTEQARTQGAEIIVYPETAIPADLSGMAYLRASIAERAGGGTVIAGAFLSGQRNGALIIDPRGEIAGQYVKRRLVPFGEAGVQAGHSGTPVRTNLGAIGIAICYESAFAFPIRQLVADGASLIAILTNDGWFGTTSGPVQHAAHSVLRAAETGRPLVRAANTGNSMLIDPSGRVVGTLPLGVEGVLVAAVPVRTAATAFVLWGWLLGPLCVAVCLGAMTPRVLGVIAGRPAGAVRLAAAVGVPAIPLFVGRGLSLESGPAAWFVWLATLAAAILVGRGHVVNRRGLVISVVVSLVLTAVLVTAMRMGYAQYGYQVPPFSPPGGWVTGGALLLTAGITLEVWLRGAVFAAAETLGGWPLAAVLSTVLGVALRLGAPQELILWYVVTGLLFSGLRLWTRDAAGLGPARALGDGAFAALGVLR